MEEFFLTIAIPSYNRPNTLIELLNSIDLSKSDIEVVICEDNSPKRNLIREAVQNYKNPKQLQIKYFENEKNLGYDENLWELLRKSSGKFIVFMGDDDEFVHGSLAQFYEFLKKNEHVGYVLKSHIAISKDNSIEYFNYYADTKFFDKGEKTIVELFRKSVLISGFCIKREGLLEHYTSELNGSLLIQLFFLSIQCMQYPSAYFSVPLTAQNSNKNTIPYFGSSENEKNLYIPGENSVSGSFNFMSKFNAIFNFIDKTLSIHIKQPVKKDMSKYIYPGLAIHRDKGLKIFYKHTINLCKLGFNSSIYFYLYFFALVILGKKNCDKIIVFLKAKLKHTPQL